MRIVATVTLFFVCSYFSLAYTPDAWSRDHAAADAREAKLIVIARVVSIERELSTVAVESGLRQSEVLCRYFATLEVGNVVRGDIATNATFRILIGEFLQDSDVNSTEPTELLRCGTHAGYPLAANAVYLVFLDPLDAERRKLLGLSDTDLAWAPRSGPFSLFELQKSGDGPVLVSKKSLAEMGTHNAARNTDVVSLSEYLLQLAETTETNLPKKVRE